MLGHSDFFARILIPLQASSYAQTYYGIILYLFLAALLSTILAVVAYLFSLSAAQDSEKRSEYECGFEPFDSATRLPFDVHFYLVGILFLIFDVEIALLFPWSLSLRTSGWFGFYIMLGFITILAVGFLYEWKRGALIWPSRQAEREYKSGLTKYNTALAITLAPTAADEKWAVCVLVAVAVFLITRSNSVSAPAQISQSPYVAIPTRRLEQKLAVAFRKTTSRLKKLLTKLKSSRVKKLEDYVKVIKFVEKRLHLHRHTLTFYVQKVSKFVALERNKNFHNDVRISQYETRTFDNAEKARKDYVSVVEAYKTVFTKLEAAKPTLKGVKKQKFAPRRVATLLLNASTLSIKNHMRETKKPDIRQAKLRTGPRIQKGRKFSTAKAAALRAQNGHKAPHVKLPTQRTQDKPKPYRAKLAALLPIPLVAASDSYFWQFVGDFLPEIGLTLMLTAVLALMACELGQNRSYRTLSLESLEALRCGLTVVAVLYCIAILFGSANSLFNGYIIVTYYTTIMKLLTVLSGRFILSNSERYVREHTRHLLEYPLVLTLSVLFMLLLVGAGHLISAFLALVGFSLNLYVLILFDATSAIAREAGIKYFYLSTVSSGLILYSMFLFFVVTGTGHIYELGHFLATETEIVNNSYGVMHLALVLLLVGLFFKLSAFPGHLWAAEVYEGSPDTITAFFMLPVKVAVLAFLTQLLAVGLEPLTALWQPIIVFSAGASLIWGCVAALVEPKTKRFLAYASINQIGFLLTGLAAGSAEGYRIVLFYLLLYAVMNVGLLVVFLNARRADGKGLLYLTDFRGFGQQYAQYSWSVAMVLFSMAGIPPLAGFFGKYYLLLYAQEQALYGLVIIGLATSLVSTYYYLRLIKIFWFEGTVGMTPVVCELSWQQTLTLQLAEWSLWLFIVQAGAVLANIDFVVDSLVVLNNVYTV